MTNIRSMKIIKSALIYFLLAVMCCAIFYPIVLVIILPIQDSIELKQTLDPIYESTHNWISIDYIARYPTIDNIKELLLYTPDFYKVFWNSVYIVLTIIVFQIIVAIPAAWTFAQFRFKGKRFIFNIYVLFMLMPFQVTMLSQYLVLDKLGLLNTRMSIILPAIFSTFSVFLIYRKFSEIPRDISDSARIDGANELEVLWHIGIPLGKNGIIACLVITFLDLWNMVEQPLAFLKDKELFPLSLYLPSIGLENSQLLLTASAITLIPSAFVFIIGQDYLEQGIIASALKE